jgi:hypothetical protein
LGVLLGSDVYTVLSQRLGQRQTARQIDNKVGAAQAKAEVEIKRWEAAPRAAGSAAGSTKSAAAAAISYSDQLPHGDVVLQSRCEIGRSAERRGWLRCWKLGGGIAGDIKIWGGCSKACSVQLHDQVGVHHRGRLRCG